MIGAGARSGFDDRFRRLFGNNPLAGRRKWLTISRSALNGLVKSRGMSDNRCKYGTGESKPIYCTGRYKWGWERLSERVMYYMELNKNGTSGDKQTKNMN